MKANSRSSRHYVREADATMLQNKTIDNNGPTVTLLDATTIQATQQGQIP